MGLHLELLSEEEPSEYDKRLTYFLHNMNQKQLEQMKSGRGFVGALDQSGGQRQRL